MTLGSESACFDTYEQELKATLQQRMKKHLLKFMANYDSIESSLKDDRIDNELEKLRHKKAAPDSRSGF